MSWFKKHIHLIVLLSCFAGFVWLFVNTSLLQHQSTTYSICIFKNITHLPCPSCGTTRAVLLLLQGNIIGSLELNPFGLIMFLVLIITPIIVFIDLVNRNQLLLRLYYKINNKFSQKKVAFPFFTIVIINWIWNLYKHL